MSKYFLGLIVLLVGSKLVRAEKPAHAAHAARTVTSDVISLDGGNWLLATDPKNEGRQHNWCYDPRPEAKPTKVPWIIQDAFPGYHGVAWYWRKFDAPANPHAGGRCLLRFWAVDYLAEVWLNGTRVGRHEGGESPFVLDVTEAVKPGESNLLAVRVLNPTHERIDGIVLNETPHRNKALPYGSGSAWNQGGIMDSVELLLVPALRIDDLFVRPDWKSGKIRVQAQVFCARGETTPSPIEFSVSPATSGKTLDCRTLTVTPATGAVTVETELDVGEPHLWNLNDPFLYRVTARSQATGSPSIDEQSVRCGFREFRFADGYFRLNGRRIYLRSSHTGNCCPIGLELPHDPDLLRRDLLNVKAMGFNMIRFIAGVAKRYQLDLCDEIGLMVYEESYAAWCLADSAQMTGRYDESVLGMIRRDRNHPSVVLWGLLNETPEGPVFRRAVGLLPQLRKLDNSRMVMLNSGRWDQHGCSVAGVEAWQNKDRVEVVGPGQVRVFQKTFTVTIPDTDSRPEPSLAMPLFSEEVVIDGPPGEYRFLATFDERAVAGGRAAVFHVDDPDDMPPVEVEVVLWGKDPQLQGWLAEHGIRTRRFGPEPPGSREVILASRGPQSPGDAGAFRELARRIARGSTVLFLCPEVFRRGDDPVGWLPLNPKGTLAAMQSWVYLKDEWAKRHPIFDGLPAGGLMDLTFYRELIPDLVWAGQEPPAEVVAAAINTSQAYSSGLLIAVHKLGAGRFMLNTLPIRGQLGRHPAAERILRNMLRDAAQETNKPPAELPADFAEQLNKLGYTK